MSGRRARRGGRLAACAVGAALLCSTVAVGAGARPASAASAPAATDAVASAAARHALCEVPEELRLRPRLPGLAQALARRAPPTIVVLDPLGGGARRADLDVIRWPARLQAELGALLARPDLRVEIVARPQADAARLAALLERSVLPRRPALVIWPVGRADFRQGIPPSRLGERLRGVLEVLDRERVDTIVVDVAYHPQSEAILRSDEHRHHLRWVVDESDAWRLRRFEMIEHWAAEGVLDLDSADPAVQLESARRVQECVAVQLAQAIAAGVAQARP